MLPENDSIVASRTSAAFSGLVAVQQCHESGGRIMGDRGTISRAQGDDLCLLSGREVVERAAKHGSSVVVEVVL
jgi:hypothetical protein